jgi:hypothetical protein
MREPITYVDEPTFAVVRLHIKEVDPDAIASLKLSLLGTLLCDGTSVVRYRSAATRNLYFQVADRWFVLPQSSVMVGASDAILAALSAEPTDA